MNDALQPTLLCLAGYEKGQRFLEEAHRQGCRVFLLTAESLRDKAEWPIHALEDIFYMPDPGDDWNMQHLLLSVAHLFRHIRFDRIVGLDDFDQEKVAFLREHFRVPGLGESATRFFRDKLAMRAQAAASGIPVPRFTATSHYADITRFVDSIPAPWMVKPRLMAGAIGIRKCHTRDELWQHIHSLGDRQSFFVLEQFVPGDIFHVDSLWWGGEMVLALSSGYGTPPFEVAHDGGIFTTFLLPRDSDLDRALCDANQRVLQAFGLRDGVSHTEFIRSRETGELLFLETSCRVGGAHIADLIEAGTGVNLWEQWARIECARAAGIAYELPELSGNYAGLLVSLARQEWPDTSSFTDPELALRIHKKYHVGFVLRSPSYTRVRELLEEYSVRVRNYYHASAPAPDRPGA